MLGLIDYKSGGDADGDDDDDDDGPSPLMMMTTTTMKDVRSDPGDGVVVLYVVVFVRHVTNAQMHDGGDGARNPSWLVRLTGVRRGRQGAVGGRAGPRWSMTVHRFRGDRLTEPALDDWRVSATLLSGLLLSNTDRKRWLLPSS